MMGGDRRVNGHAGRSRRTRPWPRAFGRSVARGLRALAFAVFFGFAACAALPGCGFRMILSASAQHAPAADQAPPAAPPAASVAASSAEDPAGAPAGLPPRRLGIGRQADAAEIAGWDIDVRPDGHGLPHGRGSVKEGEAIYERHCAACHGEFGEGAGRWPALAGGSGTLAADRPVKTIGSFWPYASTLLDYIRRAQPFGAPQSLRDDEVYAVAAYLLFLNDLVDENFVLSRETLRNVRMPNAARFYDDDRESAERAFWNANPCMSGCKDSVTVIGRARALDATPPDGAPRAAD